MTTRTSTKGQCLVILLFGSAAIFFVYLYPSVSEFSISNRTLGTKQQHIVASTLKAQPPGKHVLTFNTQNNSITRHHNNLTYVGSVKTSPPDSSSLEEMKNQEVKIILWYIKTRYTMPILLPKPLNNCPWKCSITTNHKYQNESSALLFAAQILKGSVPYRHDDQVFVFHNHEPANSLLGRSDIDKPEWRSQVNWTMWYRTDADIYEPYAIIKKRDNPPIRDYHTIIKSKTKMVAWLVSNCVTQSLREKYVKELQKYIDVDVYGGCGKLKCGRDDDEQCMDMINKDYKFYLAFENSHCKDYVTEKFFRYYAGDFILIARGAANYKTLAPNGTFIDTADFSSVENLAKYLKRLNDNDEEYMSILKRKDEYESLFEEYDIIKNNRVVYRTYHYFQQPICELCRRLWNLDQYRKSYSDINKWFREKLCYKPTDI
ncbi:alpha-(1,3)-fucosyltransferase C [Patella vulgata]|uniref:alpha-(1,3)-fucosyltransferase C n=1 Tax=Patella vulgata TaxID=6465 RepID=UPI0024A80E2C|nr:alpha-(1,3)-fucosyltransferase C [Patella vulgata]XP_050411623.2 alpha-(1,3)-fucosyltransferase C [Patella vulgata]